MNEFWTTLRDDARRVRRDYNLHSPRQVLRTLREGFEGFQPYTAGEVLFVVPLCKVAAFLLRPF